MFAVVFISDFSLQAVLRHEPDLRGAPVALVDDDSAKSPVSHVTAAAERFGVTPGITSTQAKARCDRIVFRIRSHEQEQSAQEILLECAYAFAAFIEATGPGICTLDLRGLPLLSSEDLPATLQKWGLQLIARLEDFHLTARVGIAVSPALAFQANFGEQQVNYVIDPQKFWSNLPIERLCASAETAEILRKWGIRTVSSFLALGKDKIAERLGAEGVQLFDAACADKMRPLKLTTPKQIYEEFFEFENPVETLEPLLFIVRRFLDQLTRRVALTCMVIEELEISLKLENGPSHDRTLKIPAPTIDAEVLFRILHNHLETVRTNAPIIGLSLRAQPCPSESQQFQLFESAVRDPNRFYETLGRLNALLGPERLGTPVLRDSFRPDDFTLEPITASPIRKRESDLLGSKPLPRGLLVRRFRPPLPTVVKLRNGQPSAIENSRFRVGIVRSSGPFRASGHWWEHHWAREEWDIETKQGDLLRLVHENHHWFLDAAYD